MYSGAAPRSARLTPCRWRGARSDGPRRDPVRTTTPDPVERSGRCQWRAIPISITRSWCCLRTSDVQSSVWDFCRAVDDAVDEAGGRPPAPPRPNWRAGGRARGGVRWRIAANPAGPSTRTAGHPVPSSSQRVRHADRGRRDGRRPSPIRNLPGLVRVLYPGCVGGRSHLPRDLWLRRPTCAAVRDRSRCRAAVDEYPSRRSRGFRAGEALYPARGSQPARCHREGPCVRDCGRRAGRALATDQGAVAAAGHAGARVLRARSGRPAAGDARRLVAAEIMGAIYRRILDRIEAADYDVFSRVVRIPRPQRALIAATTWARTAVGLR